MSIPPSAPGNDVEAILHAVRDHTHALLGRTITYSAEDWAAPSRLPGWTRSHVAAHLITGAFTMAEGCRAILSGNPWEFAGFNTDDDLEVLALADGLRLQIELDTSAGQLDTMLTQVAELPGELNLLGKQIPLRQLPLVRLRELVLHTADLEPEETSVQVDPMAATRLLAFEAKYLCSDREPVTLVAAEGLTLTIGQGVGKDIVQAKAIELLLWLARGRQLHHPGQGPS